MPATAQMGGRQWWVKLQCHHKGGVAKLLIARDCGGYGGLWWVFQNFFREFPYIGTLRKNPPHPPHLTFSTSQIIDRQALVQLWRVERTRHKPATTRHNPPLRFFNVSAIIIGVFAEFMVSTVINRRLSPHNPPVQYGHQHWLESVLIPPAPATPPSKKLAAQGHARPRPSVGHNHHGFAILRQRQSAGILLCMLPWAHYPAPGWLPPPARGRASLCRGGLAAMSDKRHYVNFATQYFQQLT